MSFFPYTAYVCCARFRPSAAGNRVTPSGDPTCMPQTMEATFMTPNLFLAIAYIISFSVADIYSRTKFFAELLGHRSDCQCRPYAHWTGLEGLTLNLNAPFTCGFQHSQDLIDTIVFTSYSVSYCFYQRLRQGLTETCDVLSSFSPPKPVPQYPTLRNFCRFPSPCARLPLTRGLSHQVKCRPP